MMLPWFWIVLGWASVAIWVIVSAYKIVQWSRMPLALRQEVYPLPRGPRERRRYGGSYMEEPDWASKPPEGSALLLEVIEMGQEILFFQRVRKHNVYGIWLFSVAMHWGMYLLLAWAGLFVLEHILGGPAAVSALVVITNIVGVAAFVLGALGTLGLVVRRTVNRALRQYTAPVDYLNLLLMAAVFVSGLLSWIADPAFASHRAYVGSVLTFRPAAWPFLTGLCFLLFELLLIYMPFSKLIHYYAKYFTIHRTLWEHDFMVKGSRLDKKIEEQLSYQVTWAGPHVVAGKDWREEAQLAAAPEESKR